MAISDDQGETWYASQPLIGLGNIQPAVVRRDNGTLVAYMRENGALNRIRVCESQDDGLTWGPVGVSELPNPGAGVDAQRLANDIGCWSTTIRPRGAIAWPYPISTDEGLTWSATRHLELQPSGSYHYPAVIQGADGMIHVIYSYFVEGGETMKHAALMKLG
jgi:predicted neuraminidase